jgi:hypothetical protein
MLSATGAHSTAVGRSALANDTGGSNVALGYQAGDVITSGTGNIIIGYTTDASSATVSNEMNIGDTIFGDLSNARIRVGGSGAMSGDVSIRCSETDAAFMPNNLLLTML